MKHYVLPALVAASLGFAMPASAGDRLSPAGAAALGALGGFAVGAAVGAATQPLPPPPPPPVVVERAPRRVYVERPVRRVIVERPVEECFVQRERVWVPGYGWERRRRTVCE
jgi:hypothetical protein